MGHRGSKIGFSGTYQSLWFLHENHVSEVRLRQKHIFLYMFEDFQKMMEISFFQNRQKIVLTWSKTQNLDFFIFQHFDNFCY